MFFFSVFLLFLSVFLTWFPTILPSLFVIMGLEAFDLFRGRHPLSPGRSLFGVQRSQVLMLAGNFPDHLDIGGTRIFE